VTGRQGRRREQLLDDLKEKRGYWHLKRGSIRSQSVENCFGRGYGLVLRQTAERMMLNFKSCVNGSKGFTCGSNVKCSLPIWEYSSPETFFF
jgi:hypothetical protein